MKNPTFHHKIGLIAALPLFFAGCDAPLEPGTKVDSFRVLAEQVDQPYARPGEKVRLRSLSFDPKGRDVTWAWASCVNPNSSDLQGCFDKIAESPDPSSALFEMGVGADSAALTIPADALDSVPAAARGAANVGVVSAACPGELSLDDGPGGLPFRCREPETGRELGLDELIVGFKRVTVRETERNQNPIIAKITFDGVDWPEGEIKQVGSCDADDFVYDTCPAKQKHTLAAQLSRDSFESGKDELGRDFEEQVVVQYFATEGIFEYEVRTGKSPQNGWVARKRASGQTITLWFVARDNRGGVTWAVRQVTVSR